MLVKGTNKSLYKKPRSQALGGGGGEGAEDINSFVDISGCGHSDQILVGIETLVAVVVFYLLLFFAPPPAKSLGTRLAMSPE